LGKPLGIAGLQLVGIAVATQEVTVFSTIEVIVTILPPPSEAEEVAVLAIVVEVFDVVAAADVVLDVVANVAVVLTVVVVVGMTVTVTVAGSRGYLTVQ